MIYTKQSIWSADSGCVFINVSGGIAPRGWAPMEVTAVGEGLLSLPKIVACHTSPQYVLAGYMNNNCEAPFYLGEVFRSNHTNRLYYSENYGHYPGHRQRIFSVYSLPLNHKAGSTDVDLDVFERAIQHLKDIHIKRDECDMHIYSHPPMERWERDLHPILLKYWGDTDKMTIHLSCDLEN